jgi:hypothetical protein
LANIGYLISVYLNFKYVNIGKINMQNKADTLPKYPASTPTFGYTTAKINGKISMHEFIVIFSLKESVSCFPYINNKI